MYDLIMLPVVAVVRSSHSSDRMLTHAVYLLSPTPSSCMHNDHVVIPKLSMQHESPRYPLIGQTSAPISLVADNTLPPLDDILKSFELHMGSVNGGSKIRPDSQSWQHWRKCQAYKLVD